MRKDDGFVGVLDLFVFGLLYFFFIPPSQYFLLKSQVKLFLYVVKKSLSSL